MLFRQEQYVNNRKYQSKLLFTQVELESVHLDNVHPFSMFLIIGIIYCSTHASGEGAMEDLSLGENMIFRQLTGKSDEGGTPLLFLVKFKLNVYCDSLTDISLQRGMI